MTFKSVVGNQNVVQEPVIRVEYIPEGNLPIFDNHGKVVDSGASIPLDQNSFIIGGHHQYDTFSDINNIPSNQRIAGMLAHLNTNITTQDSVNTSLPTGICAYANGKMYVISNDSIYKFDGVVDDGTYETISTPPTESKYLLANTGTKFYFGIPTTGYVKEFDLITETITRSVLLPGPPSFMVGGRIVDNKLYVSSNVGPSNIFIVDLNTFTATVVKTAGGGSNLTVGACGGFAYSPSNHKLYAFGGGITINENNNIYVINTLNDQLITTISPVGMPGPYYTGNGNTYNVYYPTVNKVYAVSRYGDKVFSISTLTDTIVDIIPLPLGTGGVVIMPVGAKLYIVGFDSGNVFSIDITSNTILKTISVGSSGANGQVVYNKSRLYVPSFYDNTVSVINTISDSLLGTYNIGNTPRAIGYMEENDGIYVAIQGDTKIGILKYQEAEDYILQKDLITWEKVSSISKAGDYIDGLLSYNNDLSVSYSDRSIPDVGYINSRINAIGGFAANTCYVVGAPGGNDDTAEIGNILRPFATIGAAISAAKLVSGSLIEVLPGTYNIYDEECPYGLMESGSFYSYYFHPNTFINYHGSYGFYISDSSTDGDIFGFGNFTINSGSFSATVTDALNGTIANYGMIIQVGSRSRRFDFNKLVFESTNTTANGVFIGSCPTTGITFNIGERLLARGGNTLKVGISSRSNFNGVSIQSTSSSEPTVLIDGVTSVEFNGLKIFGYGSYSGRTSTVMTKINYNASYANDIKFKNCDIYFFASTTTYKLIEMQSAIINDNTLFFNCFLRGRVDSSQTIGGNSIFSNYNSNFKFINSYSNFTLGGSGTTTNLITYSNLYVETSL